MGGRHKPECADIKLCGGRRRADSALRTHQDRHNQLVCGGLHRTAQRRLVARVHHRCGQRHSAQGSGQQRPGPGVIHQPHLGQLHRRPADLVHRCSDRCRAADHFDAVLIDAMAVEYHAMPVRDLGGHRDRRGDGITRTDRRPELQILAQVDRAWSGQLGAEHRRDQPRRQYAVADDVMKRIGAGVNRIQVSWVDVARYDGEQCDVLHPHRALHACGVADADFIEDPVLDKCNDIFVHGASRHDGQACVCPMAETSTSYKGQDALTWINIPALPRGRKSETARR